MTNPNQNRIKIMTERLRAAFAPEHLNLIDDSHKHIGHPGAASGAGHFTLEISSAKLSDCSTLQAHRLIYQSLDDLIPTEVHALRIKIMRTKP